jgi:hypothetical protein
MFISYIRLSYIGLFNLVVVGVLGDSSLALMHKDKNIKMYREHTSWNTGRNKSIGFYALVHGSNKVAVKEKHSEVNSSKYLPNFNWLLT